ncbi:MAG: hypothetical protein JNM84_13465 [Planctomycetes bacterium]|nr:hypothetical protein [Planctomycetota bacterium]
MERQLERLGILTRRAIAKCGVPVGPPSDALRLWQAQHGIRPELTGRCGVFSIYGRQGPMVGPVDLLTDEELIRWNTLQRRAFDCGYLCIGVSACGDWLVVRCMPGREALGYIARENYEEDLDRHPEETFLPLCRCLLEFARISRVDDFPDSWDEARAWLAKR